MHILVETCFISFSFYSLNNITPANKLLIILLVMLLESIYFDFHLPNFRELGEGVVVKIPVFGFLRVNFGFLNAFFY